MQFSVPKNQRCTAARNLSSSRHLICGLYSMSLYIWSCILAANFHSVYPIRMVSAGYSGDCEIVQVKQNAVWLLNAGHCVGRKFPSIIFFEACR